MRIDLFATRSDLAQGIAAAESAHRLHYVLAGLFESPSAVTFASAFEIEDLGVAHYGDSNHEKTYLVADAATEIRSRPVPQRLREIRYSVDPILNPTTFAFRPGGMYRDSTLISGYIGTATADLTSLSLCKMFAEEVIREYVKHNGYYLGPEAARLLSSGFRLTASVNSPAKYDLQRW